jgi:hypothetical protein
MNAANCLSALDVVDVDAGMESPGRFDKSRGAIGVEAVATASDVCPRFLAEGYAAAVGRVRDVSQARVGQLRSRK